MKQPTFAGEILLVAAVVILALNPIQAAEWIALDSGGKPEAYTATILSETSRSLLIEFRFYGFNAETIKTEYGDFDLITLPDVPLVDGGALGSPALPGVMEVIALPEGTTAGASLREAEWVSLGEFRVSPVQYPLRDGDENPGFAYNPDAYTSKEGLPDAIAQFGPAQGWGGLTVAGLNVTPFEFTPASGELRMVKRAVVQVDFQPAPRSFVRPHRPGPNLDLTQRAVILNDPAPRLFDADENEPVRLMVALKEEALEIMQPLIDFHEATGMRTEVFLADDLNNAEELKEAVQERYEEGLEYLLLIGDGYQFNWDVPMYYWDPEDPGESVANTDTHSDTWYACMDGPNQDGFEDCIPDFSVGRLTYEDPEHLAQLELQVAKILDYMLWRFEQPDNADWLNRTVLVANPDFLPDGGPQEYINCSNAILRFNYRLPHPELLPYYGNDENATIGTLLELINGPGVGIFNYRGHGTDTAMYQALHGRSIDSGVVRQMENRQEPFILISSACENGNIATRISDCIIEHFQKQEGGSLAAHGCVISTFTDANSYFDQQIFKAWFHEDTVNQRGIPSIGYAANAAMAQMVLHWDHPGENWRVLGRMNARAYIWLADPTLDYRLNRPAELTVDIPDEIAVATQFITGAVQADDQPVEGAVVCVRTEDNAIYQVAQTNERGFWRIDLDPPLQEPGLLLWAVTHREGIPVFGEIIAADGEGAAMGTVTDFETDAPIEGATLFFEPFNIGVVTDVNGFFHAEGIPEAVYTVTASAPGYLPASQANVVVSNNDTAEVNLQLRYSLLEIDREDVAQVLAPDARNSQRLTLSNIGNGPLTWQARLTDPEEVQPYSLLHSIEIAEALGDTRLSGVVFVGDRFYVAGGNNNADPNFIHVLDRAGNPIPDARFNQPAGAAGIGIRDLGWDGECLYGSSGSQVYRFNLEGEVLSQFQGPFNPSVALTVASDGTLWVANNRSALIHLNVRGDSLGFIPNDLAVRALAWDELAADGMPLLMYVRGGDGLPLLYGANPESGEIRLKAQLSDMAGELPADGLSVSRGYTPAVRLAVGIVNSGDLRFIRLWTLGSYSGWLTFEPLEGVIPAGEEADLTLNFSAEDLSNLEHLETTLLIESDGRNPLVELPISLTVDMNSDIQPDWGSELPSEHLLASVHPNPFNARTTVTISLPAASPVRISVFDLSGREAFSVYQGSLPAGAHEWTLDGEALASGIYLLSVSTPQGSQFQKIAIIR